MSISEYSDFFMNDWTKIQWFFHVFFFIFANFTQELFLKFNDLAMILKEIWFSMIFWEVWEPCKLVLWPSYLYNGNSHTQEKCLYIGVGPESYICISHHFSQEIETIPLYIVNTMGDIMVPAPYILTHRGLGTSYGFSEPITISGNTITWINADVT